MLTAGAAGAKGVGAHVGRVDVDLDRVVHLGIDEHAGEAGVASAGRVKRALAHQAVHPGFGAQLAVGVVALDLDRCAADARDVALGLFHHLGLEALAFAVTQVLPQQHAGPVAGLGATGAGLNVDEAIARVERVGEHAAELQRLDFVGGLLDISLDGFAGGVIAFLARHLEQLAVIGQRRGQALQPEHHGFERLALAAQLLRSFGVVPDLRVFERPCNFH